MAQITGKWIGDGQITTPKIADGAVISSKVEDGAIVPSKIDSTADYTLGSLIVSNSVSPSPSPGSGNVLIEGNLQVYGTNSFQALEIAGDATIGGNCQISGQALVYDTLTVVNALNSNGNLYVAGDASVNGDALFNGDVQVQYGLFTTQSGYIESPISSLVLRGPGNSSININDSNIELMPNTSSSNNVIAYGDTSVVASATPGNLYVAGDASVIGNFTTESGYIQSSPAASSLTITAQNGPLYLNSDDILQLDTSGGNIISSDWGGPGTGNAFNIYADTTFFGNQSIGGTSSISGDTTISGNLQVLGDASVNGIITTENGSIQSSPAAPSLTVTAQNGPLYLNSNNDILQLTTDGGNIISSDFGGPGTGNAFNIYADTTFLGNQSVGGASLFIGDATFTGKIRASNIKSTSTSLSLRGPDMSSFYSSISLNSGSIFILPNPTVAGYYTLLYGDTSVNPGNFYVGGKCKFNSDATVNGNLQVNGNFIPTDMTVNGNLRVNGDSTVNGNFHVGGNFTVGSSYTAYYAGSLSATGDTTVVIAPNQLSSIKSMTGTVLMAAGPLSKYYPIPIAIGVNNIYFYGQPGGGGDEVVFKFTSLFNSGFYTLNLTF